MSEKTLRDYGTMEAQIVRTSITIHIDNPWYDSAGSTPIEEIDTEAEARALAESILEDLKKPGGADGECTCEWAVVRDHGCQCGGV